MTRGRDSNTAYLYERIAGEGDHEHAEEPGLHVMLRGTSHAAVALVRGIIAVRDDRPQTAHDVAAQTNPELLPTLMNRVVMERRTAAVVAGPPTGTGAKDAAAERQRWITSTSATTATKPGLRRRHRSLTPSPHQQRRVGGEEIPERQVVDYS
jgi:hypothetical protein